MELDIHPRLGPEDSEELWPGPVRPLLPGDSSEGASDWSDPVIPGPDWLARLSRRGGSDWLLLSSIENSAASRAVVSAASGAQGEQL